MLDFAEEMNHKSCQNVNNWLDSENNLNAYSSLLFFQNILIVFYERRNKSSQQTERRLDSPVNLTTGLSLKLKPDMFKIHFYVINLLH